MVRSANTSNVDKVLRNLSSRILAGSEEKFQQLGPERIRRPASFDVVVNGITEVIKNELQNDFYVILLARQVEGRDLKDSDILDVIITDGEGNPSFFDIKNGEREIVFDTDARAYIITNSGLSFSPDVVYAKTVSEFKDSFLDKGSVVKNEKWTSDTAEVSEMLTRVKNHNDASKRLSIKQECDRVMAYLREGQKPPEKILTGTEDLRRLSTPKPKPEEPS